MHKHMHHHQKFNNGGKLYLMSQDTIFSLLGYSNRLVINSYGHSHIKIRKKAQVESKNRFVTHTNHILTPLHRLCEAAHVNISCEA